MKKYLLRGFTRLGEEKFCERVKRQFTDSIPFPCVAYYHDRNRVRLPNGDIWVLRDFDYEELKEMALPSLQATPHYTEWEKWLAEQVQVYKVPVVINDAITVLPPQQKPFLAPKIKIIMNGGYTVSFSIERLREILWTLYRQSIDHYLQRLTDEANVYSTSQLLPTEKQ